MFLLCYSLLLQDAIFPNRWKKFLDEYDTLVSQGVKEFQVIAQELTYYGIDRYKKQMLPELIERISDIPGCGMDSVALCLSCTFPNRFIPGYA